MSESNTLLNLAQLFFERNIDSAAQILESMAEEEAIEVLKSLPAPLAVRVVKVLQIGYAATLLRDAEEEFLREMITHSDPQFLATILMRLPKESRQRMSQYISGKLKVQVSELLDYPEGSIGREMTVDFVALDHKLQVEEAIEKI